MGMGEFTCATTHSFPPGFSEFGIGLIHKNWVHESCGGKVRVEGRNIDDGRW